MRRALARLIDWIASCLVAYPGAAVPLAWFFAHVLPIRKCDRERLQVLAERISGRGKFYKMLERFVSFSQKMRRLIIKSLFVDSTFQKRKLSKECPIPPPRVLNIFVTRDCNLGCKYCFVRGTQCEDMDAAVFEKLLKEIDGFRPAFICISGGEPLLRPGLLEDLGRHKDVLFLVFTNGLCFDEPTCRAVAEKGNIIPIFSIDGSPETIARKRNDKVWPTFERASAILRELNVPFGFSCHLEQDNYDEVVSPAFVSRMVEYGCMMGWFSQHIPQCASDVANAVLTPDQRIDMMNRMETLREYPIALIDSAADSRYLGSCAAGGAVMCHVEANGDICPCQFLPFSVGNIRDMKVADAVATKFFAEVRGIGKVLSKKDYIAGCCALDKRHAILDVVTRNQSSLTPHSHEMASLWRSFQVDVDVYDAAMQCKVDEDVSFRE